MKNKAQWIRKSLNESISKLLQNGKIENVGEGNTEGAIICDLLYLDNNKFVEQAQIKISELPKGKYDYVYFFVRDLVHTKETESEAYFLPFKNIEEVDLFLLAYYEEHSDDFYGDERENKKYY
jgi:hypothetical protein